MSRLKHGLPSGVLNAPEQPDSLPRARIALVAVAFVLASAPVVFRDEPVALAVVLLAIAVVSLAEGRGRLVPTVSLSAFVLWAALSLSWTYDAANSTPEVLSLVATVATGFAFARFGARTIRAGLLVGSGFATVASLAVGLALPSLGRSAEFAGAFTGLYAHRNFLATVAIVFLALSISGLFGAESARSKWKFVALCCIALACVVSTLSGSGIVLAVAVSVGALAVKSFRALGPMGRLGILPILGVAAFGFAIPAFLAALPALTGGIGRDATLTGRTEIWSTVLRLSADRPLAGYGWGGVWRGEVGGFIRVAFGYDSARSAHNGFLDVVLLVGWVGAALLAMAIVATAYRTIRLTIFSSFYAWMPLLMLAILVNSYSESVLIRPLGSLSIATVAAVSLWEGRTLLQRRRRTLAGAVQAPPVEATNQDGSSARLKIGNRGRRIAMSNYNRSGMIDP